MKKLITLVATFLLGQSLFALEFNTVKVSDGTTARCNSKADQIRFRAGAYRFKAFNAQIKDAYRLEIAFALQFLKCQQTRNGFQMSAALPYEEFRYEFTNHIAVNSIDDVKIKAYRDGQYKILMEETLKNTSAIKLTFNQDIASILTAKELKILDAKGEIKTSIDFFIAKKVATSSSSSNFKRNINFGSFRVHVKLEKKNGQIKAKILR